MKIYYTNVTSTPSSSSSSPSSEIRSHVWTSIHTILRYILCFRHGALQERLAFGGVCSCFMCKNCVFSREKRFRSLASFALFLLFFNYTSIISYNCHANFVFTIQQTQFPMTEGRIICAKAHSFPFRWNVLRQIFSVKLPHIHVDTFECYWRVKFMMYIHAQTMNRHTDVYWNSTVKIERKCNTVAVKPN